MLKKGQEEVPITSNNTQKLSKTIYIGDAWFTSGLVYMVYTISDILVLFSNANFNFGLIIQPIPHDST